MDPRTKALIDAANQEKLPGAKPPTDAINTTTSYIQARENSIGADQTSPNSWLSSIQSISTPAWFNSLQPKQDPLMGSETNDYRTAHQNNYIIKTTLRNCIWDFKITRPTSTTGVIYCELTDTTLYNSTKATVPNPLLPFGWTRTGNQIPAILYLIKQNNVWLVNKDGLGNTD